MAVNQSESAPAPQEIGADVIATWYTPAQAFVYAATAVGEKGAAKALWELLLWGDD
jgi:hypothetical protein